VAATRLDEEDALADTTAVRGGRRSAVGLCVPVLTEDLDDTDSGGAGVFLLLVVVDEALL